MNLAVACVHIPTCKTLDGSSSTRSLRTEQSSKNVSITAQHPKEIQFV